MKLFLAIAFTLIGMMFVTSTQNEAQAGFRHRACQDCDYGFGYGASGYYGHYCVPGMGAYPYNVNYSSPYYRPRIGSLKSYSY